MVSLYLTKTHGLWTSCNGPNRLAQPLGGRGGISSLDLAELLVVADEEHVQVCRGGQLGMHRQHVEEVLEQHSSRLYEVLLEATDGLLRRQLWNGTLLFSSVMFRYYKCCRSHIAVFLLQSLEEPLEVTVSARHLLQHAVPARTDSVLHIGIDHADGDRVLDLHALVIVEDNASPWTALSTMQRIS